MISPENPTRVLIVGGGFAGLASAARLAQSGVPVTLFESAAEVGRSASTLNQGWLHSGGTFARSDVALAAACCDALRRAVGFCPGCIEAPPARGLAMNRMVYFARPGGPDPTPWLDAWDRAGIPFRPLTAADAARELPDLRPGAAGPAFALPDRAFRPDVLLEKLAAVALAHGAEVRCATPVLGLVIDDETVRGVELPGGETVRGGAAVLATGAFNRDPAVSLIAGRELPLPSGTSVGLHRTHLVSCRAGLKSAPFHLLEDAGLNALPHGPTTVFGAERWEAVDSPTAAAHPDPGAVRRLWEEAEALLPAVRRDAPGVREWAGVTAHAVRSRLGGDLGPAGAWSGPVVIDHGRSALPVDGLFSVFPGRATMWAHAADIVRQAVLERIDPPHVLAAAPPWGVPGSVPRATEDDDAPAEPSDEADGFEFVAPAP
ncbi:NAD(P)/FAD-dependent oxidoreductase [Alienimonas sp. DA493]|uniref:NAD(P)/FAD-dependent oxidoreductase n=1 Tax=Alienimonas sp. DA493 TaxID=3373605 RepID=UPI003753F40F